MCCVFARNMIRFTKKNPSGQNTFSKVEEISVADERREHVLETVASND